MQTSLPNSAQRAITVTRPYQLAYASPLPRRRWQVILPETGEIQELSENDFIETWVLESECPPAVRKMFDGMPAYASWRWGNSRGA